MLIGDRCNERSIYDRRFQKKKSGNREERRRRKEEGASTDISVSVTGRKDVGDSQVPAS